MIECQSLQIEVDGVPQVLTRVGPGALSVVYESDSAWYRIYPAEIPLKWKSELKGQLNQPSAGGVKSVRFWQDSHTGWYVMRYDREPGSRLLTEVIESGDVLAGLEGVAASLRAIPMWWSAWQSPLLPMPSDIVLSPGGKALLLRSPRFRLPTVDELFAEPSRCSFLAPELFRRNASANSQGGCGHDLYALGIALLSCFFVADAEFDPKEAMLRAATAVVAQRSQWRDSLPFWIEHVDPTRNVIALGRRLAATSAEERGSLDLAGAADYLSNCRHRMEPRTAVREARIQDPHKALILLEDLLLENESYELLLEGADLAEYVGNDLQALRLYQRAIEIASDQPEPYRRRFDLIAGVQRAPSAVFRLLYEKDLEFGTRLDRDIRLDFDTLERLKPQWAEERELTLARHYLQRGHKIITRYQSARDFIRDRVHDSTGGRRAWKLELRLVECEVLLEQGDIAAAAELFNQIVHDINRLAQVNNPHIDKAAVRRASEQASQLRRRLAPPVAPQDATS